MSELYSFSISDDGAAHVTDHTGWPSKLDEAKAIIAICQKYIKQNTPATVSKAERKFVAKAYPYMYDQCFGEPLPDEYKTERELRPKPKIEARAGYIYLIYGESTNWYKIGQSVDPKVRQKQLGTQGPFKYKVIHTIKVADMDTHEHAWHERFKDKRVEGEWFTLTAEDIALFVEQGGEL